MCKFTASVMTLNMYSSIFILVIISVDRCITAKFRETKNATTVICYNNFEGHHKTVVFIRFTFGFLIPFLTIFICYSILICKLRANLMSKFTKPFKIMTLLITAFFICWLPIQIVSVLALDRHEYNPGFYMALHVCVILACANSFLNPFLYAFMLDKREHDPVFHTAQQVSASLACANSFLNPFLYAFNAKDSKKKCYSFLSKIESAIDEETRSAFRATSITNSVDNRLSITKKENRRNQRKRKNSKIKLMVLHFLTVQKNKLKWLKCLQ
ncbi:Chemokine-like receptor 1 [Labeo rohita]|uniref:Chemokine-like receptor 1 n=1 Tax=Labeo rohita TaxID=84645 RepID=A0ABQ8L6D9_LABRO|nr:Chemokine-like receptor 1 [Labeo rohita]